MSDPERRLAPAVRLAPAKLNLTLAVVGRRADGYHALHSVVVPLGLADRLSVALRPAGPDSLHVDGFDAGPTADNLVLRAISAIREAAGLAWPGAPQPLPPLAARLDKRIPVAAGLGGGSSDAAAAIEASLEVWSAELESGQRMAIALALGSDVPLFLAGSAALIEGRGERVTPLHGVRGGPDDVAGVVLVTPAVAVATADVFAAWAAGAMAQPGTARRTSEHFASEFGSGLSVRQLVERAAVLAAANDLLPAAAAVVPGLVAVRRALARRLRRPIGLSGSGPTLWALYPSRDEAAEAAAEVQRAIAVGEVVAPGSGPPVVTATTLAAGPRPAGTAGEERRIEA